jgi:excisionase family DNA binding protein
MKLLTVNDVAEILKASRSFVYDLLANRKIAYFKVGGKRLVSEEDLHSYLDSQRVEPTEKKRKVQRPRLKHLKL